MTRQAVITGDIVNSTRLSAENERKLLARLSEILQPYKFEFYRGDSFQALVPDSTLALPVALMCRTTAIGMNPEASAVESDVRISIGIGKITGQVKELATAKGEAFILSGRALDNMDKAGGKLVMSIENHLLAGLALQIMSDYVNSIYSQMTAKQAEVMFELLKGETQQQVAERLNRSKSTISQHVTAGKWDEIDTILKNYTRIIEQLP